MVITLVTILAIALYVLVRSADVFVDAMSSLAAHLRIPTFVIAFTIVAFGTSTPELAISFNSLINGDGVLTLSNVVGANIVNILLVLGIASLVHPIRIKSAAIRKEIPLLILITAAFAVMFCDRVIDVTAISNVITRNDGLILILLFCIFIKYLFDVIQANRIDEEDAKKPKYGMFKTLFLGTITLLMILKMGDVVVEASTTLATLAGVSEKIVGMVIIGIGTSLPELVTSIICAKQGDYDFAIGNIVGTNIFNICIVLGLPVLLLGNISANNFSVVDMGVLFLSTVILYLFSRNDRKLSRLEGILMLVIFFGYYAYVIFA